MKYTDRKVEVETTAMVPDELHLFANSKSIKTIKQITEFHIKLLMKLK